MTRQIPRNSDLIFKTKSWLGVGLLFVSAATLCFEINLTRLFSVSQFYHFAFMVVSIALLGFGASGTFLALQKKQGEENFQNSLPWSAVGSGACMLGAYLLVNHLPFDSFSMFVDPSQIAIFFLHFTALALPFFFSGMVISMMLREYPAASGKVYSLNLVGSALGCLAAVILPHWVGGEGVVAWTAALNACAGICFLVPNLPARNIIRRASALVFSALILGIAVFILVVQVQTGAPPRIFKLHRSPYKSISYALQNPEARVLSSHWNSFSKVELVSSPSLHSVPGLSFRYQAPLPTSDGLFVDGDNLNAVLPPTAEFAFTDYLPAAIAFQLRPGADILILEPKGGLAVQAALAADAAHVTAVEANPLVIEAAEAVYSQPEVELIQASGRSFLKADPRLYDLVQLPLTDSYYPIGSGAYALREDYRFTIEAITDMIARLKPDGLLVITRWLQEDPSEWLRVFTLAISSLEKQYLEPHSLVVAFRGYNTGTLLVKPSGFQPEELNLIRQFAREKAFDLVHMPDLDPTETNHYNILPEPVYYQTFRKFLETQPRTNFYRTYPYDVKPPTDDHPFFSHFFKWSQMEDILRSLGTTWQPFGGAGYFVILVIFGMALILSSLLILIPVLIFRKSSSQLTNKRIPIYFGLIGLGFLLVEIPLIQHFTLYLDQPAYALVTILFCILFFSGLGSRYGSQLLSLSWALILLIGLLLIYILGLPCMIQQTLAFPLATRLILTVILIAPIGFLMGTPFPSGLNWIQKTNTEGSTSTNPRMIAWAWAVNGATSVIASILASLLVLSFGFQITFGIGTAFYGLAWVVTHNQLGPAP